MERSKQERRLWARQTSFVALALRAQGKLKVGLAIGFLALAPTGVVTDKNEDD